MPQERTAPALAFVIACPIGSTSSRRPMMPVVRGPPCGVDAMLTTARVKAMYETPFRRRSPGRASHSFSQPCYK